MGSTQDSSGGYGTGEELASGFSNTGNSTQDAVSNSYNRGYGEKDAAAETGSSGKETSKAWHTARDDYEQDTGKNDRHKGSWW